MTPNIKIINVYWRWIYNGILTGAMEKYKNEYTKNPMIEFNQHGQIYTQNFHY
jgi:hypothetical protein